VPGLVVISGVVEEVEAGVAGGLHDADPLLAADPVIGAPGAEGQPAHLDAAAAEGHDRHIWLAHAGSIALRVQLPAPYKPELSPIKLDPKADRS
jgi:hypothetical protein